MRTLFHLLFLGLFLMSEQACLAQDFVGQEFRIAFLKNLDPMFNGPPTFDFSIFALESGNVSIAYGQPGDVYYQEQSATLQAGQTTVISFPNEILNQELLGEIETRSFHIVANAPIRLYAYHHRLFFSDATPVLPIQSLGHDYYVITHQTTVTAHPSLFNILAAQESTSVTIVPSVNCNLGPANAPINIELNAGEVITLSSEGDLTGSRVSSSEDTPFAVYTGHRQVAYPGGCAADNHIFEQMMPFNTFGVVHPLIPTDGSGGDLAIILALEDDTEITIGCEVLPTLDAGEHATHLLANGPQIMLSSAPTGVMLLNQSNFCSNLLTGDPNLRMVLPLNRGNTELQFRSSIDFITAGGIQPNAHINLHLAALSSQVAGVLVNGETVSNWQNFPALPEVSYAVVPLDNITDLTTVTAPNPVWAEYVALKNFDALAMSLGSDSEVALPPLAIELVDLGGDRLLCPGSSIELNAGGVQGTWQNGSTSNTFEVSAPGTYYFNGLTECAFDTITVELSVPILELDTVAEVCEGDSALVGPFPLEGYTYLWSSGQAGSQIAIQVEGAYTLTATNPEGCDTSATVNLVLHPLPQADIVGPDQICEGDTAVLLANGTGSYTWGDGTTDSTLVVASGGTYTLEVTSAQGCTTKTSAEVSSLQAPIVFSEEAAACAGESTAVVVLSPNGELVWELPEGLSPELLPIGEYTVWAVNTCAELSFSVEVSEKDCSCDALIPNIFSPNSDGRNDRFEPQIVCDTEGYIMRIFNRWGKQVFESTSQHTHWDGSLSDGSTASEGIYFYTLDFINTIPSSPERLQYKGWLNLVR